MQSQLSILKQQKIKLPILFSVATGVLLVCSLFYSIFIYPCLILCVVTVLVLNNENILAYLLFLFPYAVIFKESSGSTSFFTYVELFAILVMFLRIKKAKIAFFLSICVMLIYLMLNTGISVSVIKLLDIFFLFYLFTVTYKKEDSCKYFSFFVAGMLSSTFLGIFKEDIPRLLSMYSDLNYETINGERVLRFSGIFADPNYYSLPILFCLTILLISILNKNLKYKKLWIALFLIFAFCGAVTVSKTFFIMFAAVVIIILLDTNLLKNWWRVLLVLMIIGIFFIWNPSNIVSNIFYRFEESELSTGRTYIWDNYWQVINSSNKNMFFGLGLDAGYVSRPSHNMYIETIYHLGFVGLVLYLVLNVMIIFIGKKNFKRKIINYIGFIIILVCYVFLCGLTAYDFPFYLMLAYMIYQTDLKHEELIIN